MNALFEHRILQTLFQHDINAFGLEDLVIPIQASGKETLSQVPDRIFDVIYQDGSRLLGYIIEILGWPNRKLKTVVIWLVMILCCKCMK
jgi:hypothetical protein